MTKRYYKYSETHRTVKGRKQKYCNKCKKWKSEIEFGIDRAKRDGLKMRCRECDRAYARALLRKYRKGRKVRIYLRFEQRHRTVKGVRQKLCCTCKQWKSENQFYSHRSLKDGLSLRCKECQKRHARKRLELKNKGIRKNLRFEERHRTVKGAKEKLCTKCKKWKAESEFYINKSRKDSLTERCKKCIYKAANRSYTSKGKGARRNLRYEERHRVVNGINEKLCTKCRKWKKENLYYKQRSNKDGLSARCKKCTYKSAKKPLKARLAVKK